MHASIRNGTPAVVPTVMAYHQAPWTRRPDSIGRPYPSLDLEEARRRSEVAAARSLTPHGDRSAGIGGSGLAVAAPTAGPRVAYAGDVSVGYWHGPAGVRAVGGGGATSSQHSIAQHDGCLHNSAMQHGGCLASRGALVSPRQPRPVSGGTAAAAGWLAGAPGAATTASWSLAGPTAAVPQGYRQATRPWDEESARQQRLAWELQYQPNHFQFVSIALKYLARRLWMAQERMKRRCLLEALQDWRAYGAEAHLDSRLLQAEHVLQRNIAKSRSETRRAERREEERMQSFDPSRAQHMLSKTLGAAKAFGQKSSPGPLNSLGKVVTATRYADTGQDAIGKQLQTELVECRRHTEDLEKRAAAVRAARCANLVAFRLIRPLRQAARRQLALSAARWRDACLARPREGRLVDEAFHDTRWRSSWQWRLFGASDEGLEVALMDAGRHYADKRRSRVKSLDNSISGAKLLRSALLSSVARFYADAFEILRELPPRPIVASIQRKETPSTHNGFEGDHPTNHFDKGSDSDGFSSWEDGEEDEDFDMEPYSANGTVGNTAGNSLGSIGTQMVTDTINHISDISSFQSSPVSPHGTVSPPMSKAVTMSMPNKMLRKPQHQSEAQQAKLKKAVTQPFYATDPQNRIMESLAEARKLEPNNQIQFENAKLNGAPPHDSAKHRVAMESQDGSGARVLSRSRQPMQKLQEATPRLGTGASFDSPAPSALANIDKLVDDIFERAGERVLSVPNEPTPLDPVALSHLSKTSGHEPSSPISPTTGSRQNSDLLAKENHILPYLRARQTSATPGRGQSGLAVDHSTIGRVAAVIGLGGKTTASTAGLQANEASGSMRRGETVPLNSDGLVRL